MPWPSERICPQCKSERTEPLGGTNRRCNKCGHMFDWSEPYRPSGPSKNAHQRETENEVKPQGDNTDKTDRENATVSALAEALIEESKNKRAVRVFFDYIEHYYYISQDSCRKHLDAAAARAGMEVRGRNYEMADLAKLNLTFGGP